MFSKIEENRKRSFNDLVTGLQRKRASAPDYLKLVQILREMTSGPERRFVPESPAARREKKDSRKVPL
jgi:hypothetical protein